MSVLQIRTVILIILGLLVIIVIQCNEKPESNKRILELEVDKKALEASKAEAMQKYSTVAWQRDSALEVLQNKPEVDKLLIHNKHEIIRDDIVLLTDSQSVQLLSANFRRKRSAGHN